MEEKYFTVPEIAKHFKVSKSYIYDLISQKKLQYIRLSERRIRVPESALKIFNVQNMNNWGYNRIVQPLQKGT